jgi:hypothetical protein
MPDYKKTRLIAIYMYISELYEMELQYTCQRQSNNFFPEFTDQEIMTIYLFAITEQKYFLIKDIYLFAKEYLNSWFPKLPSYQAFNSRLNRLSEAFKTLAIGLFSSYTPEDCDLKISLIDSMPIVTCKGKNRNAKVAREVVGKGWCSTKNMYYYGLKLHLLGFRRPSTIPFPEFIGLTAASENDLAAFKELFGDSISDRLIFGDRIFFDQPYFEEKFVKQNIKMFTPIKLVKGETETIRQREKAYRDLYSASVSKVRQPAESFFNWLNEKTKIQEAQKVRSTKGLVIHVFGKIAAAFIFLIF